MRKHNLAVGCRGAGNSGALFNKGWQVRGISPIASQAEQSDTTASKRKDKRVVVGTIWSLTTAEDCRKLAARNGRLDLEVVEAKSEAPVGGRLMERKLLTRDDVS